MIEGEEVSPGAGQIHHGVGVQMLRLAQQRGAHTLALEAGGHCQGAWQRNNKPSPTIEGSGLTYSSRPYSWCDHHSAHYLVP